MSREKIESPQCPYCSNSDSSMMELLPKYKWDVIANKFIKWLCLVCSKEF